MLTSINYFLYIFSNLFYLFLFIILKLNNLKIYKFLKKFNYILFFFIFFIMKPNVKKIIFFNTFFLFLVLSMNQT